MDGLVQVDAAVLGLYDRDFAAWAFDQAARLRQAASGGTAGLDWANLAEEIEALARSDRRALASHVRTIASHLMKLQASPACGPQPGWKQSIRQARLEVQQILEDSPSLRGAVTEAVARELPWVRRNIAELMADYGETPRIPLEPLTYTPEQIIGDWWPA